MAMAVDEEESIEGADEQLRQKSGIGRCGIGDSEHKSGGGGYSSVDTLMRARQRG